MKIFLIIRYNSIRKRTLFALNVLTAIVIIGGSNSCRKFLETPLPSTQLVTASTFNNDASATAALTTIYAQMWTAFPYTMSSHIGAQADELKNYSTAALNLRLYRNALTATFNDGQWNTLYSYVYQANAIIQGLQQYGGTSPAVKQQLTGEAYFIRAFCYLYLTSEYGAVPMALTPNYLANNALGRTPRVQVLQQVVADLKQAQALLNTNYVDGTDTTVTNDRVRPNKAVAVAMLARAYLYLGDFNNKDQSSYQNAEAAATAVITNPDYSLASLTVANSPFLIDNTEAIWQLATVGGISVPADTEDGYEFILTGAPSTGSNKCYTISQELMDSFESGDQRQSAWIGSITKNNLTYYFPYKYKNNTLKRTEYSTVLRLAEQYLIRAEARAEQGNITGATGALADLNVIRNRAGLANYAGAQDPASVLAAILHERQVELFCEWGHRWFDLIRSNNANAVMGSPGNVCQLKGGTWNPDGHQELYPIYYTNIQNDPDITQNPGY